MTVVKGDFDSLSTFLRAEGIQSSDLAELQDAVASDPAPTSAQSFGPRVSNWVGQMLVKAADGSWEISLATAGALLAYALAKYYGLDRKRVVWGKRVAVRVVSGGRRSIKKKK